MVNRLIVILTILVAISGCGGGSDSSSFNSAIFSSERSIELELAIDQVNSQETPQSVDAGIFSSLQQELIRQLEQAALVDSNGKKRISAAGQPEMSMPWCSQARFMPDDSAEVIFRGQHLGDYDLNGEVNAADLVPLAIHFGKTPTYDSDGLPTQSGENEQVAQCDGNSDGEVGVADITPIALNFTSRIAGYRVYLGTGEDVESVTWQQAFQAGPDSTFSLPFSSSTAPGEVLRYELPVSPPLLQANESLFVRVAEFDGISEGVGQVILAASGPHDAFYCDTCHNVTNYNYRGSSGLCDMCHPAPPEDTQSDWQSTPGLHGQCELCHESHGFRIAPPESVCSDCHTDKPSPDHHNGQTVCLGCHQQAHLPLVDTSSFACMECHTTPPEDILLTWDQAPGLHASCELCHPGDHPDKPIPAESVCADCHSEITAEASPAKKQECLICHQMAHVPDAYPQTADCQTCHPTEATEFESNSMTTCFGCHVQHTFEITYTAGICRRCHVSPPDQPGANWDDAPGQHGQCQMCHERHEFVIPDANGVCASCHQTLIDGGHAGGQTDCLGCHQSPHLPLAGTGDCQSCHTNPPENTEAQWADAPGLHAACDQCHVGDHGSKPVPPESICSSCHTDKPNPDHGGGLTACLTCHQFSHLPVTDLSQLNCEQCHTNPPEDLSAEWTDAPGQHAQCSSCHEGPEHGNKPIPPESICSSCHTDRPNPNHGGGLSTCLDCHQFAHLPVADLTQLDCKSCHPVPPERPDKEWGDAPGDHDRCLQCHFGPEHGNSPEPTRDFCNSCHNEHHGGQNLCLQCHNYPHLPED